MTLVSSQCRRQEPHPYFFWSLLGYAPLLVIAIPNLRTFHPFFLLIGDSVWSHLQTAIIYTQFLQVDPVIPFTLATGAAPIPAHISWTLQLQCERQLIVDVVSKEPPIRCTAETQSQFPDTLPCYTLAPATQSLRTAPKAFLVHCKCGAIKSVMERATALLCSDIPAYESN